jgi:hypothetical protein
MTSADPAHMFDISPSRKREPAPNMTSLYSVAMPVFEDDRGKLSLGAVGAELPFTPVRYFLVYDVPVGEIRGSHAHRRSEQFMIAVSGTIVVTLDDGTSRVEHRLDRPNLGLHVPADVWGEQRYLTPDARLLVLASEVYDRTDYVESYEEFLRNRADRR